jgi:hypothetical protein
MTEEKLNGTAAAAAVSASEMEQLHAAKEPTVVESPVKDANVRFVCIGMGQGGTNIMSELAALLPHKPFQIAINTSTQDLDQVNLPENQKFVIGGAHADGAGQNRNRAKAYYKDYTAENIENKGQSYNVIQSFIALYEEVLFHPNIQTIILVSFTSDGGSGSGLGPMFVTNLTNYINSAKTFVYGGKEFQIDDLTNSVPRPVVCGLVPKCELNKGLPSLLNTIDCFNEIQQAIMRLNVGSYFIADNNLNDIEFKTTEEKYNIINARIAVPLLKFLGIEMNSSVKCMDLQDKINTLRISGCNSFVSLESENLFQYVAPKGQTVSRVIPMLTYEPGEAGEKREQEAEKLLKQLNITSMDTKSVFFNVDKSAMASVSPIAKALIETSMIGFFGFKDLSTIVEDLRERAQRLKAEADQKAKVVQQNASGFSSLKEDKADFDDRFHQSVASQDDIDSIF